jgi:hypothetical protein
VNSQDVEKACLRSIDKNGGLVSELKSYPKSKVESQKIFKAAMIETSRLTALKNELLEAREVIGFYADMKNYDSDGRGIASIINGDDEYIPGGHDGFSAVAGKRAREFQKKRGHE